MAGPNDMDEQDQEQEREDQERKRIHEGHETVEPEPGVTAELDEFTEEEQRQEPAGVMPGGGPDEEPGADRERPESDTGAPGDPGQDTE